MSRSTELGEVKQVELSRGTVRYRERGSGRPVVFIHGLLVNGDLWRKVVPEIAGGYRCITPDLPLGSHEIPMRADADLSVPGVARLIADFLEALDLDDVVLVANDTGGALTQIVITEHPQRIGAVVLTSCDAYDNFLPLLFQPLIALARFPFLLYLFTRPLSIRALRRLPIAFGWLAKRRIDDLYSDGYVEPFGNNREIRRDCCKVLRDISPRHTNRAAAKLGDFDKPVLIAWAAEDRFFPVADAERLESALPNATLELVEDSYTFISEDQPRRLVELMGKFFAAHGQLRAAG
jgi:pimeloyl-ACP methyl ester carboxylesterase